ncbi:unnamed protein product [Triticum turgidum subsp. durum]|uniref:DOC domain-containing protein n=1 Tax=Triticum turgidum subsp. durum TaxID=4567 RepID=A0A9R0TYY6_TRITD|nr:unnamed protein product [Triticum turgidum subsp. durum]
MAMDLQRQQPLHLGFPDPSSLGWAEQPWRRIRSVHGRSTSGNADHGQRPDGGGYRRGCCSALRSLHVSSCASGGQTLLRLRPRGTLIVSGFIFLRSDSLVTLYMDFKLDESYTLSKISIWTGDGFHNLKAIPLF